MITRELMRMTDLMTSTIQFALSRVRFIVRRELLKLKGIYQRDSQEAVNQSETSQQEAQESLSLPVQGN